jgi:hypothetical protein
MRVPTYQPFRTLSEEIGAHGVRRNVEQAHPRFLEDLV